MPESAAVILVVEDDRATREALLDFLAGEGYRPFGAENGSQALEMLATIDSPRLILLDLMMPVMDGWEFLARAAVGPPDGPAVVLLSGLSFIRDAPGVADFLSKPIDFGKLRDCVERFCGRPGL